MKKIIRILVAGIFASLIILALDKLQILKFIPQPESAVTQILYDNMEIVIFVILFAIFFFTIAIPVSKWLSTIIQEALIKHPMEEILIYVIGLGIGLAVANLAGTVLQGNKVAPVNSILEILLYLGLGFFGVYIVHQKKDEIKGWFSKKGNASHYIKAKILDTSVIIDGRILDIINTGFIEGKVVIPSFVLDELRHIADAPDKLKRNRGRRGLDILNEIKKSKGIPIEIFDIDYKEIDEVDSKLLKLAQQIQGSIVTNDFNLNKVAQLQKIKVLNINDLANAVKPIVLPNEEMSVTIVKEGKEQEQGLAYLNDGTMIVVEGGKKHVGSTINIVVTTVLQTSAGRMIFAKPAK